MVKTDDLVVGNTYFMVTYPDPSSRATPSIANVRNTPWAVYFQDDWKFSRRITLNLGLRYEYHQPYREQLLGGARFDLLTVVA